MPEVEFIVAGIFIQWRNLGATKSTGADDTSACVLRNWFSSLYLEVVVWHEKSLCGPHYLHI